MIFLDFCMRFKIVKLKTLARYTNTIAVKYTVTAISVVYSNAQRVIVCVLGFGQFNSSTAIHSIFIFGRFFMKNKKFFQKLSIVCERFDPKHLIAPIF